MDRAKASKTPMCTTIKLDKDENGKSIDEKKYRNIISSLFYLTANRLDIIFVVCICARFQSCPKESHLNMVKFILKYLVGTSHLGLWYYRSALFDLVFYLDANSVRSILDRKSTFGTYQFLENSLIS